MLVREAMTRSVITIGPGTSLRYAARLLAKHHVTSVPVLDEDGLLVGVISEADVVRDALIPDQRAHLLMSTAPEGPEVTYVGEVMSRLPVTVSADDDLAEAVRTLTESTVKSLPVTKDGRLVGMLSRADVVRQLAQRDDVLSGNLDALVHDSGWDWTVEVDDGVVVFDGPGTDQDRLLARAIAGTVPGVTGVRFATVRA